MLGELTREEIRDLLENNIVGRIGCSDGTKTYIVPVSYLVKGDSVLCHSREGLKIEMMRKNPNVCFEVDEIKDYTHWKSVIGWGIYEEITDDTQIAEARSHFSEVMLNLKASQTSLPPESMPQRPRNELPASTESIFYRIRITEVYGRFEKGH
jgi:nitroimidazol reductase NimA-like FMN-containing flavoprotein (pyridoxamine 5'-phosphate oxidase superfamily)